MTDYLRTPDTPAGTLRDTLLGALVGLARSTSSEPKTENTDAVLNAKREHRGDWMAALHESENVRVKELYDGLMLGASEASTSPVRPLLFRIVERSLGYYQDCKEQNPLGAAEFNAGIRALLTFAEGEMGDARRMGRALRLPDIVDKLDAAQKFGVSIDASIDLGTPGAVRHTSAQPTPRAVPCRRVGTAGAHGAYRLLRGFC